MLGLVMNDCENLLDESYVSSLLRIVKEKASRGIVASSSLMDDCFNPSEYLELQSDAFLPNVADLFVVEYSQPLNFTLSQPNIGAKCQQWFMNLKMKIATSRLSNLGPEAAELKEKSRAAKFGRRFLSLNKPLLRKWSHFIFKSRVKQSQQTPEELKDTVKSFVARIAKSLTEVID